MVLDGQQYLLAYYVLMCVQIVNGQTILKKKLSALGNKLGHP